MSTRTKFAVYGPPSSPTYQRVAAKRKRNAAWRKNVLLLDAGYFKGECENVDVLIVPTASSPIAEAYLQHSTSRYERALADLQAVVAKPTKKDLAALPQPVKVVVREFKPAVFATPVEFDLDAPTSVAEKVSEKGLPLSKADKERVAKKNTARNKKRTLMAPINPVK